MLGQGDDVSVKWNIEEHVAIEHECARQKLEIDHCPYELSNGFVAWFDDTVGCVSVGGDVDWFNGCIIKQKLKAVSIEFWSMIVNHTRGVRVTREPAIFKEASDVLCCFGAWDTNYFNEIGNWLPNLGATQPGDVYYMTALTVAILGIVDCSMAGGSLDAYAYHEGVGGKGGKNVASIHIMLLKHKGWLKADISGGELTELMDNCGGQNNNNHALHLANVLVEAGYFKKVSFMFYVVGHTKNVADRWFNTMKKDYYRCQNIYKFNQLSDSLGTNEQIAIHSTQDGNFKNFRDFEDLLYKDLESGSIQPGHIFSVESHAPTVINVFCVLREALCDFFLLKTLPPTRIKEIKQIELYEKWRKLVPAEFADIICSYPGAEVMRKFKDERNCKTRERSPLKRVPRKKKAKTQ
eukprot:jgi/Psemu1/29641/gm1.29641_g